MLVVYGSLGREQVVAGQLARCSRCGVEALQEVVRYYRVAILWMPLWSYGEHFAKRCGHCLCETAAHAPEGPVPAKPFIDRFGGLVLGVLIAIPAAFAVSAVRAQVEQDLAAAEAAELPQTPVGERVLAAVQDAIVLGKGTGLDARGERMAAAVHAALAQRPEIDGQALGVAGARVMPRGGERRIVLLVRGELPRDRASLTEIVHAANLALADHHEGEMIVLAFASRAGLGAVARGHHHDAWQLQTDPRLVRGLVVEALTY